MGDPAPLNNLIVLSHLTRFSEVLEKSKMPHKRSRSFRTNAVIWHQMTSSFSLVDFKKKVLVLKYLKD